MNYAFHPEARAEFLTATDFYEEREPGLGSDFAIEVHATIENIVSFPMPGLFLRMTCDAARSGAFLTASSIRKRGKSSSFLL